MYNLLFKIYSHYLMWVKDFRWRYYLYRFKDQIEFEGIPDIDQSVHLVFQTETSKLVIGSNFIARSYCSFLLTEDAKIVLGNDVFFNRLCSLNAMQKIEIGDSTIFGENVKIYDHNHKFSNTVTDIADQGYKISPVSIGRNCWIGSDTIILPGVTIGDNVIIGAGNLIFKSLPSNTIIKAKRDVIVSVL